LWRICIGDRRYAPDIKRAKLEKPVAMLLFGMLNWMFTWLRPDGRLTHETWRLLSFNFSSAVWNTSRFRSNGNPAGDAVLHRAQTRARAGTGNALPFTRSTGRVRDSSTHTDASPETSGRLTDSMQTMAVAIFRAV